jgi:hypothetical protein
LPSEHPARRFADIIERIEEFTAVQQALLALSASGAGQQSCDR